MLLNVCSRIFANLQIVGTVVCAVFVFMVDNFSSPQFAPKYFLHHSTVFKCFIASIRENNVSLCVDVFIFYSLPEAGHTLPDRIALHSILANTWKFFSAVAAVRYKGSHFLFFFLN